MEEREDQIDRLDFIRNQMNLLTLDVKKKIKEVTEEVANKVMALSLSPYLEVSVCVSTAMLSVSHLNWIYVPWFCILSTGNPFKFLSCLLIWGGVLFCSLDGYDYFNV